MPALSRLHAYRKLAFVLAILLLAGVAASAVWGAEALERSRKMVEHSYSVIGRIDAVDKFLHAAEAGARGYRLASHPAMRDEYASTAPDARLAVNGLAEAVADNPAQTRRAAKLRALATERLDELQRLIGIQDELGPAAAIADMRVEQSVRVMQAFDALAADMRAEEYRLLAERQRHSTLRSRALLGFVLLSILASLATLWALLASLTRENARTRVLEREARQAVARLERAQALSERLSSQRHALSLYAGVLQSCQNLDEAMEATANVLQRLLPHVGGRCYVGRPSRDFFEAAAHFGREAVASSDLVAPGECWALRRGQPHHLDGREGGMRCAHLAADASLSGISTLCVPLVAQGDTLGLLHASAPSDGGEDDNDASLIESVAEQLAMAMANLRLRETLRVQSLRDPLTGLFNRRYLEENLARELQRCERRGLPLSLLMIDVDHFKRFNDQHGHAAGDAVLAHVGRTMQSLVRGEDLACRYGGEEFTIVMPEADAGIALERAELIRRAVSSTTILHLHKTLGPVTISIGIATFPQDGATPQVLFEVADASLYRAKAEGRDRVLHATAVAT